MSVCFDAGYQFAAIKGDIFFGPVSCVMSNLVGPRRTRPSIAIKYLVVSRFPAGRPRGTQSATDPFIFPDSSSSPDRHLCHLASVLHTIEYIGNYHFQQAKKKRKGRYRDGLGKY
jgi:hypothetical protein